MSPVALHRDSAPWPDCEHLEALPAWIVPSPLGAYWHQPRSAYRCPDGALTVHLWCGQARHRVATGHLTDTEPTEMRCGTCAGRRAGYDSTAGLVFCPQDLWQLPARCPGGLAPDKDTCLSCGARPRAAQGWNAGGLAQHRPALAMADRWAPCPAHGWSRMGPRGGRQGIYTYLACGHYRCSWGWPVGHHGEGS